VCWIVEGEWIGRTQEIHVCGCDVLGPGYPLYIANSRARRDEQLWVHEHVLCSVTGTSLANTYMT
jgi:cysteinyl-tRNA synthetase